MPFWVLISSPIPTLALERISATTPAARLASQNTWGPAAAPALAAPEALEHLLALGLGDALAVVGHAHRDALRGPADADLDRRARGRVHDRVAQQVREHLTKLQGVAGDDCRPVGVQRD